MERRLIRKERRLIRKERRLIRKEAAIREGYSYWPPSLTIVAPDGALGLWWLCCWVTPNRFPDVEDAAGASPFSSRVDASSNECAMDDGAG